MPKYKKKGWGSYNEPKEMCGFFLVGQYCENALGKRCRNRHEPWSRWGEKTVESLSLEYPNGDIAECFSGTVEYRTAPEGMATHSLYQRYKPEAGMLSYLVDAANDKRPDRIPRYVLPSDWFCWFADCPNSYRGVRASSLFCPLCARSRFYWWHQPTERGEPTTEGPFAKGNGCYHWEVSQGKENPHRVGMDGPMYGDDGYLLANKGCFNKGWGKGGGPSHEGKGSSSKGSHSHSDGHSRKRRRTDDEEDGHSWKRRRTDDEEEWEEDDEGEEYCGSEEEGSAEITGPWAVPGEYLEWKASAGRISKFYELKYPEDSDLPNNAPTKGFRTPKGNSQAFCNYCKGFFPECVKVRESAKKAHQGEACPNCQEDAFISKKAYDFTAKIWECGKLLGANENHEGCEQALALVKLLCIVHNCLEKHRGMQLRRNITQFHRTSSSTSQNNAYNSEDDLDR